MKLAPSKKYRFGHFVAQHLFSDQFAAQLSRDDKCDAIGQGIYNYVTKWAVTPIMTNRNQKNI